MVIVRIDFGQIKTIWDLISEVGPGATSVVIVTLVISYKMGYTANTCPGTFGA